MRIGSSEKRPSRACLVDRRRFFVLWIAIILAGSDIPPPRGFVWVVAGLVVICIGMALAIPWLWGVGRRHGLPAVLVRTSGIGFGVGLLLAAAFALFSSGEPSIPLPRWMSRITRSGSAS